MARRTTTSKDRTGEGGELHQAPVRGEVMTTAQGVPMGDDQNSLRAGERGPTLLEDFAMREKIFHFDHERIPERVVHARGYGAHGYLECLDPVTDLTRAAPFARKGKRSGRNPGGQPGHPGAGRGLVPIERVDEVREHLPERCAGCGHSLAGQPARGPIRRHQVAELPAIAARVT